MVEIVESPIDPAVVMTRVEDAGAGAICLFSGVVRNQARGKGVTHLFYECYSQMALKELQKIRQLTLERWELKEVAIVHRTGRLEIGDCSVLIAVSSAHRSEAFEACRYVIDTLKRTVPIWKKEHYGDGETWVEAYGGG